MKTETKKIIGAFSIGLISGVGLVGVMYEKLRKDYNNLVDKSNEYADFIDKHDFYKREDETIYYGNKPEMKCINTSYDPETGVTRRIYEDKRTGFKVFSCS